MTFSDSQLSQLADLAATAAIAAGRVIDAHRQGDVEVHTKAANSSLASQVVTEVDHKAQAAILELLRPACRELDLAILAEESKDDGERHARSAFWCVDPLDGTLPFVQGLPGFSVSIALVARDGTPLIGVVFDPVSKALYRAVRGQGARKNDTPIAIPSLELFRPLILRTDFSFKKHPWFEQTRDGLQAIADELGMTSAEIHFRTGAVLNACELLETPHICYFKYPRSNNSGGSLWDYAATACLFHEAGGFASDLYGQPMELNRVGSTFLNHRGILYAAHRELAERIIQLHRRLSAAM